METELSQAAPATASWSLPCPGALPARRDVASPDGGNELEALDRELAIFVETARELVPWGSGATGGVGAAATRDVTSVSPRRLREQTEAEDAAGSASSAP